MPSSVPTGPLYMGFDLSTQQLKGLVVDSNLKLQYEAKVDFDADVSKHGIEKGVLTNPSEGEIFAPVAMWLDAIDLVLDRLKDQGLDFGLVKGMSGAGMQHGTVFWSREAEHLLHGLNPHKTLVEQLEPEAKDAPRAFSHPHSPNWQDASTQKQCERFDAELGSPEELARVTGSKAHHRFSGPQILRWHQKYPKEWKETSRISLVSSFLASVFLGKFAPLDIGDVCGMNLREIKTGKWSQKLLQLTAGSESVEALEAKLGPVPEDGGGSFGSISSYFVQRYGFPTDCSIIPFTGDNPATILALPLRPSDAIVSLGTSTTFLMSTPTYLPDPAYHFMNHPTTAGLYMFMLCYKNGGLAREQIRNTLNTNINAEKKSWDAFNQHALETPPLDQSSAADDSPMRMGLFFPRPEIVPNVKAGQWRYEFDPKTHKLTKLPTETNAADARTIIESQMLSLRLRSAKLIEGRDAATTSKSSDTSDATKNHLPPQPRRVYLVGGGSINPAIARIAGQVLGGVDGVYRLDIGGNACALGAAYKAVWGCERRNADETFEELIESRWKEEDFVERICDGYTPGIFERYGEAIKGFEMMERDVLRNSEGDGLNVGGVMIEP